MMQESELLEAAESVFDGWYTQDSRIDWEEFWDRLELHADCDLGSDLNSPLLKKIRKHILNYRKIS